MIVRPGSKPARRRARSRRCFRFIPPLLKRSKVDFFLFAISFSCRLKSDPGSARLAKKRRLYNGVVPRLLQGRPATNQCIAAAEVMLLCGHSGTNPLSTIACRPGLRTIRNVRLPPTHVSGSIHRAWPREYAVIAGALIVLWELA